MKEVADTRVVAVAQDRLAKEMISVVTQFALDVNKSCVPFVVLSFLRAAEITVVVL